MQKAAKGKQPPAEVEEEKEVHLDAKTPKQT